MTTPAAPHETVSLRGPEAQRIGRRFWVISGTVALVAFAAIIAVSFFSAANDNARIQRLKSHGLPVVVTVTDCVGNIGGSGSNAAGYTCHGSYRVGGVRYQEVIGSKTTVSPAGTKVAAIADPQRPSTVELARAVARSSSSSSVFVVPSLLALLLVVLTGASLRRARTTRVRNVLGGQ